MRNFAAPTDDGENGQAMDRRPVSLPRLCGRDPRVRPRFFPERTLVMSKEITTTTPPSVFNNKEQSWHSNTDLGCDVKTILRNDVRMVTGKEYRGMFRLDSEGIVDEFYCRDPHYTFIEILPQKADKRHPHMFEGEFITATRQGDRSPRLNFKKLKMGGDFNLKRYALGVYNEICMALGGMVEK